ncbi:unnamed protein product [Rotaria socialis]|uniref:G-protein coupled receptors family 1 profile domain-containing protein n=2 Tax=Rotaria socialis TaxID=392032 RepID=A0A820F7N2_9BILA|nr:unnamed protein product [Rotaria socialis]CAF4257456.1 unnamed protein product [Rotaria socialis]
MLILFSRVSTWLFIEMIASLSLVVLNLFIPMLMVFGSFRNAVNFYLSSAALSSSMINFLYLIYLIQTLRSRVLSENNCRAIYYLQTSCILILAYTIVAMHANFILCLFPSSSAHHHSARTCLQSFGVCLRRIFRRFCYFFVICLWSFAFIATIPLLYSIDSNEKLPKPVYCPGTTQVSYREELFNRNRFTQTIIFNLIPLILNLFLSLIAVLKLLYDCLVYLCARCRMSKCSLCRKKSSSMQQSQSNIPNAMSFLSSLSIVARNNMQHGINLAPVMETTTAPSPPDNEINITTSDFVVQSCGHWLSKSFIRSLLVISVCLLACIYPVVMRFYLVYFSVLLPLVFALLNYSFVQLQSTQQQTTVENYATSGIIQPAAASSTDTNGALNMNKSEIFQNQTSIKRDLNNSSSEQFELQSSLIKSLSNEDNRLIDTPSTIRKKQKYFSNRLYENSRTLFISRNH